MRVLLGIRGLETDGTREGATHGIDGFPAGNQGDRTGHRHRPPREQIGTRYVFTSLRTLVDPSNADDLIQVRALQDAIVVDQPGGPGRFDVPPLMASGRSVLQRRGLLHEERVRRLHAQQHHGQEGSGRVGDHRLRRLRRQDAELFADHEGPELHGAPVSTASGHPQRNMDVSRSAARDPDRRVTDIACAALTSQSAAVRCLQRCARIRTIRIVESTDRMGVAPRAGFVSERRGRRSRPEAY